MAKNLIDLGDRKEAHGKRKSRRSIGAKRTKRSVVKRKITIYLKALSSELGQFGSKFPIRRIIADLKQCLERG